jgi:TrmH family RNA methyltransferase
MRVSIALVEPEQEVNVGHIARLMQNFGLTELLLIKPSFDRERAKIFAAHGKALLDSAKTVRFGDLEGFDPLIGTTAIRARGRLNLVRDAVSPWELPDVLSGKNSRPCILLGREATGLTNEELAKCDVVVSINTPSAYKTLNIAHALAILLYEIHSRGRRHSRDLAGAHEAELIVSYALALAESSGMRKHRTRMLELALKRVLGRGTATSKEAMLLVSLLRKANLAVDRKSGRK